MHLSNKPPRRKRGIPEGPVNPKDTREGSRIKPAAAERTEAEPESENGMRPAPDASTTNRQPVTNQDEQDRITNAGHDRSVPEK